MIACEITGSGKRISSRTTGLSVSQSVLPGVGVLQADDGDDLARAGDFQPVAAVAHQRKMRPMRSLLADGRC